MGLETVKAKKGKFMDIRYMGKGNKRKDRDLPK